MSLTRYSDRMSSIRTLLLNTNDKKNNTHAETDTLKELDSLTDALKNNAITDREAFYTFLQKRGMLKLNYNPSRASKLEERNYANVARVRESLKIENDSHDSSLFTLSEEMFAFLCLNADALTNDETTRIENIATYFYKHETMSVDTVNWQIAGVIFNRYTENFKFDWHDQLRFQILIGYIQGLTDKKAILNKIEELNKLPFPVYDYVLYRMSNKFIGPYASDAETAEVNAKEKAKVKAKEKESPKTGEFYKKTFADALIKVMQSAAPSQDPVLDNYNHVFLKNANRWAEKLNEHYQRLSDKDQEELAEFVDKVREFHDEVQFHSTLKDGAQKEEQKRQLGFKATEIRTAAKNLFYLDRPVDGADIVLGIGLLLVGATLVALGIMALLLVPPVGFIFASAATAATSFLAPIAAGAVVTAHGLAIASVAAGTGSMVMGSLATFFGHRGSPFHIKKELKQLSDQIIDESEKQYFSPREIEKRKHEADNDSDQENQSPNESEMKPFTFSPTG